MEVDRETEETTDEEGQWKKLMERRRIKRIQLNLTNVLKKQQQRRENLIKRMEQHREVKRENAFGVLQETGLE